MTRQKIHMERVYVKVTSVFDSTGYMQPKTITWADGRVFPIESVKDYHPVGTDCDTQLCDCYTITVKGETKRLFFERLRGYQRSRIGRWYVEVPHIS